MRTYIGDGIKSFVVEKFILSSVDMLGLFDGEILGELDGFNVYLVGMKVGIPGMIGLSDGFTVGVNVGFIDGENVGIYEGDLDGNIVGSNVGIIDGKYDGLFDGFCVGNFVGFVVGDCDIIGDIEGVFDGNFVGTWDGVILGIFVGLKVGEYDGTNVGFSVIGFVGIAVVGDNVPMFDSITNEWISNIWPISLPPIYIFNPWSVGNAINPHCCPSNDTYK